MKTSRKYGEKEKIQILIKSLIYCILLIYIFSLYAFIFLVSLADAEMLKDISKHFISFNRAADNFSQMVKAFT